MQQKFWLEYPEHDWHPDIQEYGYPDPRLPGLHGMIKVDPYPADIVYRYNIRVLQGGNDTAFIKEVIQNDSIQFRVKYL